MGANGTRKGDNTAVAQALGIRDQFFASLATEANLAALLENRPRSIRLEAGSAEAIGDCAELLAELTDHEDSAVDEVQESLLDEDLLDRLALIH